MSRAGALSRGSGRAPRQRCIALIMVLWLVVLLTLVAASFATHSRVETRMTGNLLERQKVRMLIQTGLNRALLEMMVKESPQRWLANVEIHELQETHGSLRIAIRNGAGLVDLNRASREILYKLFVLIEESAEARERLVDALADWRDADDLKHINGAEDSDYRHAGLVYGTAGRDLESVDELGYVMGFNRDAVDKLRPYVTVHSGSGRVDNNYASQELLDILRDGERVFESQVADALSQIESELADIDSEDGTDELGQVQSSSYRISIEATTGGGARSAVEIDVKPSSRGDKPFRILAWHRRY